MSGNEPERRGLRIRRGGFALPMAILTLALVTAAIVAAFSSTSAEVVANNAMRAQDRAYQLAQTGLQQFMLRRGEAGFCSNCVLNPAVADSEWTRVNLTGGYADVVAMRVRPRLDATAPALFFVRSTGVDTSVKLSGAGSSQHSRRSVGQYASFGTSTIKAIAAWTSFSGIYNRASTTPGNGDDRCNEESDLAGFVVPAGGQYHRLAFPFPHFTPAGSPQGRLVDVD